MTKNKIRSLVALSLFGTFIIGVGLAKIFTYNLDSHIVEHLNSNLPSSSEINKDILSKHLSVALKSNSMPDQIDFDHDGKKQKVLLQYTIDPYLQAYMHKLIKSYSPDYGAFVAIDSQTGKVLSMLSLRRNETATENFAIEAKFPAASVFKVVTASAVIDTKKGNPDTIVPFNGANHTLYKKNVSDIRENRWTRYMTIREAFSRSVNTVFGKLGVFYAGPTNLISYAEKFFFNRPIHGDFPIEMGQVKIDPTDPWSVASAASGFTRDNTMSPLQGALIASAIANDGVMMEPYLINSVNDEQGNLLYSAEYKQASVIMTPESAVELRSLMAATVTKGTSRKSFRQTIRQARHDDVEMGGKTGSLTGLDPKGKCDWFVGYVIYNNRKIAVAALTVNEKNWKVKSSQLASFYLHEYIKREKLIRSTASR